MNVTNIGNAGDKLTTQLREAARTLGSAVAALWLLAGIFYAITDPWTLKSELVIVFLFFLALGVGISFWKEIIGGLVLIVLSVAFSTFACIEATHNHALAVFLSGGPFFIVGSLFFIAWFRSKKTAFPTSYCSRVDVMPTDIDIQSGV